MLRSGSLERRVRLCERSNSADSKVSEEGLEGGAPSTVAEIFSPAAHDEDHGEAGCPSAAHGGPWWSRYPPVAHGRPHTGTGGYLKEAVTLWEASAGAGSCPGPVDLCRESSPRWSRSADRACDPMGDP